MQALGGLCTHAGPSIPQAGLQSAATAVMASLEAYCGDRQSLVEGVAAGRFYSTLLRTLSVLLFEVSRAGRTLAASLMPVEA